MKNLLITLVVASFSLMLHAENFKSGSAKPTKKLQKELTMLFETQVKDKDLEFIAIEGHTDPVGSHSYNQKLSERRAKAAKKFFVNLGVNPLKISTVGHGENKLISKINAENRRVVVSIKNVKAAVIKTVIADAPKPVVKNKIIKQTIIKEVCCKKCLNTLPKEKESALRPFRIGIEGGAIKVEDMNMTFYGAVRPSIDIIKNKLNLGVEATMFKTDTNLSYKRAHGLPNLALSARVFDLIQVDYDRNFRLGVHYKLNKKVYLRGSIGSMKFDNENNFNTTQVGVGYEF